MSSFQVCLAGRLLWKKWNLFGDLRLNRQQNTNSSEPIRTRPAFGRALLQCSCLPFDRKLNNWLSRQQQQRGCTNRNWSEGKKWWNRVGGGTAFRRETHQEIAARKITKTTEKDIESEQNLWKNTAFLKIGHLIPSVQVSPPPGLSLSPRWWWRWWQCVECSARCAVCAHSRGHGSGSEQQQYQADSRGEHIHQLQVSPSLPPPHPPPPHHSTSWHVSA